MSELFLILAAIGMWSIVVILLLPRRYGEDKPKWRNHDDKET